MENFDPFHDDEIIKSLEKVDPPELRAWLSWIAGAQEGMAQALSAIAESLEADTLPAYFRDVSVPGWRNRWPVPVNPNVPLQVFVEVEQKSQGLELSLVTNGEIVWRKLLGFR